MGGEEQFPKLTKKQHEKDSEVFGAIWAGARSRRKKLRQGLPGMETPKGMCAVGAGLRGRKKTRWSDVVTKSYQKDFSYGGDPDDASDTQRHQLIPMVRFSAFMEVSENYACGVNDGFENKMGAAKSFYRSVDMNSLDYLRGWSVGQAVLVASNAKEAK